MHESTIKLVRKYLADLESFCPVGFEIQRGKPQSQGEKMPDGAAETCRYADFSAHLSDRGRRRHQSSLADIGGGNV